MSRTKCTRYGGVLLIRSSANRAGRRILMITNLNHAYLVKMAGLLTSGRSRGLSDSLSKVKSQLLHLYGSMAGCWAFWIPASFLIL